MVDLRKAKEGNHQLQRIKIFKNTLLVSRLLFFIRHLFNTNKILGLELHSFNNNGLLSYGCPFSISVGKTKKAQRDAKTKLRHNFSTGDSQFFHRSFDDLA